MAVNAGPPILRDGPRDVSTPQAMKANPMKRLLPIAIAMVVLGITACTPGKYPISGETCAPDDPVKTLDADHCLMLPGP